MGTRVFDCVLFNGEYDVLEIRLNELKDLVHLHIVVESKFTFSGLRKEVRFDAEHPVVRPFADKIKFILVDDFPTTKDAWDRESWQRNAIDRGLDGAQDDDLILMSDVDEIPKPAAIRAALEDTTSPAFGFCMKSFYFFLNYQNLKGHPNSIWAVAARYSLLRNRSPDFLRYAIRNRSVPARIFEDGGWHFSYLGDDRAVRAKIMAFSHQEYNTKDVLDNINIAEIVGRSADIFNRAGFEWAINAHPDLPACVASDRERYSQFFVTAKPPTAESAYRFTNDWFTHNVDTWRDVFAYSGVRPTNILEIGPQEGRSTIWITENLLSGTGGSVTSVDAWAATIENGQDVFEGGEARFDTNIAIARLKHPNVRIDKRKGGAEALCALIDSGLGGTFDLVYVDGSHLAADVLTDAVLSFQLCRVGGLIFFDDYLGASDQELSAAPKLAVDAFVACFHRKLRIIPKGAYQFYVQKVSA